MAGELDGLSFCIWWARCREGILLGEGPLDPFRLVPQPGGPQDMETTFGPSFCISGIKNSRWEAHAEIAEEVGLQQGGREPSAITVGCNYLLSNNWYSIFVFLEVSSILDFSPCLCIAFIWVFFFVYYELIFYSFLWEKPIQQRAMVANFRHCLPLPCNYNMLSGPKLLSSYSFHYWNIHLSSCNIIISLCTRCFVNYHN